MTKSEVPRHSTLTATIEVPPGDGRRQRAETPQSKGGACPPMLARTKAEVANGSQKGDRSHESRPIAPMTRFRIKTKSDESAILDEGA